ncbi:hypothetical protein [uncultured Pseudomonas sp.]|uniref:hypothetical protein n=1 Tax=uncultured Pseudomonas sp. TaxID=114707 RepID=UPI002639D074|nr:hypothetical protein [uncultured Pseudomonas sp.]
MHQRFKDDQQVEIDAAKIVTVHPVSIVEWLRFCARVRLMPNAVDRQYARANERLVPIIIDKHGEYQPPAVELLAKPG